MWYDSKCNLTPPTIFLGASSLSFDMGYPSLVGSRILLSTAVEQWAVILEFSQKKMSSPPSPLPSYPTETEPDLPLSVSVSPVEAQVSSGLIIGQGLRVQQTLVWYKPSCRRLTLTPSKLPELTEDWENRLLEGTSKTLCTPGPRKKEQWPHKRLTQTYLWVSRSLQWRNGLAEACCRDEGTECDLLLKEVTHSTAHQQKIGLKTYWAWPHPSEQDPVSPSISLSHQEASISLLSLSIWGQTEWKPQLQKTNQIDHMDHNPV